ncbi:MAG TPA: VOC family protein [Sedimentisphaerales bacterium]|nr:VOC family protein [Sedimentisphaerales bacterium]
MIHKLSIIALAAALTLSMLAGCAGIGSAYKGGIRLEHIALNVPDPVAMAQWYCDNLGMKVRREGPAPVNMRFISDAAGNMMLELYNNPQGKVPDYRLMDPLSLHIAFHVDDVPAVRRRLLEAGATAHNEVETTPAGDVITILRDPWGMPIQFLTRAKPMLK